MLSREKAKLRSALDNTNSQMHNEVTLKRKPIQTFGVNIIRIINFTIFRILLFELKFKSLIADLRKV